MPIGILAPQDYTVKNVTAPWATSLQGALQGYGTMQDIQTKKLANQNQQYLNLINQAKSQYAQPMAQAELAKAQQEPSFIAAQTAYQNAMAKGVPSEIAQRYAMAQLNTQQAKEAQYKLAHPELYQPTDVQTLNYMMHLGNKSVPTPSGIQNAGMVGSPNVSNNGPSMSQANNQNFPSNIAPSSNLISGTNIPKTGSPFADAYIQNKFTTPEQRATIELNKQQQSLENKNIANEQNKEFQDMDPLLKIVQEADNFHESYKNAHRTGSAEGTWPSSGWTTAIPARDYSNDQKADTSASLLQAYMTKALTSRTTNMLFKAAGGMKLQRSLDPNAESDNYNKIKGQALRGLQLVKFRQEASRQGIKNYNDQNSLWASYNMDKPAYDPKTGKMNEDNLTDNSIRSYLSKQTSNNNQIEATAKGRDGKQKVKIKGKWYNYG
jgi:hypothetical protein